MIKTYCDVCKKEFKDTDHVRIQKEFGEVAVEVMVQFQGCWDAGHVCHECIKKVIKEGRTFKK